MTRKSWIVLALLITLTVSALPATPVVTGVHTANAQSGNGSLVFLKDGDLWRWDGSTLVQLSTWGYNQEPVLSPQGGKVAYNSWATITINAIAAGKPVFGLIPSNIWVMDIESGDAQRIADQPADAAFFQDGVADRVVMRGTPAWSPDGSFLAWVELTVPENRYQLVVYNNATGTAQTIVQTLPPPFADGGFIPVHDVMWGTQGLLITNLAVNGAAVFEDTAYLYTQDGTLINQSVIGSSETEFAFNTQWISYNGQEYLGMHYPSGKAKLLDVTTGTSQDMPALPELYSRFTPEDASAIVAPSIDANQNLTPTWTAVYPNRQQDQLLSFTGEAKNIAVSPDGQALAYLSDALYIWQNGTVTQVPGTGGIASYWDVAVVWGPTGWRVRTDWPGTGIATGMGGGAVACTLAPRLVSGMTGQVTPGLPNVIRSQPRRGPDSFVYGEIPAGGVFTVLNGPICGPEGRYWWEVSYQGTTGWTAEGQGYTYWLQPYQPNTQPVCGPTPRLTVGSTAYVTPGLPNVIRTQPRRGPDSYIAGIIPGSGVFTVLSGPQCGPEGRYWWQINYAGITGWTAEGEGNVYWTAPFGCPQSPTPRLAPGMQANVTPGLPNRLRSGPGTQYDQIGSIPGTGIFTVLSGPQCGPEGWSYWRVQYGNQIGWTAEGDGSTYWLEPYTYTPIPTPTPQPVACTLPPRMINGAAGRVLPGLDNVIRSNPGTGSNSVVTGEIPANAIFAVEQGPVCGNDGRYWWKVQYMGLRGWTAEGQGSTYWIEPYTTIPTPTPQPKACTLAPRLTVGASAYVTPGAPNVIRSNPGTGSNSVVIGQIPGGAYFYVDSSPVCGNDGRYWYQIEHNGITGWTAEGENPTYWTSPFVCAYSEPTRLVPGGIGRVTPGDPNTIRSAAGTGSSTVVGSIPGGATFLVTGNPQCGNDGRVWWPVLYNGLSGWTAEGEGATYWLEPVR